MAKRRTKQQREAEQKERLLQRLEDLFLGATGEMFDGESQPWPEDFISFVQAVKRAFEVREDEDSGEVGNAHLWSIWNLSHYRTPAAACDFLYDCGVRAD